MSKGKKVKLHRPLTDDEKKKVLREHFYYEVTMLDFSVERLLDYRKHNNEKSFENMAVDTCLLHARNLLEFFFYRSNMNSGYTRARDIQTTWQNPQKTTWIRELERRVNDEITHLTLRRISSRYSGMNWDCCAIRKEFFDVAIRFLGQVPRGYINERLRKLGERISSVLGSYVPEDKNGVTSTSSNIDIFRCW